MTRQLFLIAALVATSSAASAQAINVTLSEFKLELSADTVKAGNITFRVNNKGVMTHMLYVRGEGVAKGTKEIPTKQAGTLVLPLKPGTYEVYCPMSDDSHKMAGMVKNLVVVAGEAAEPKKP